jgi:hypothetical protein
MLRANRRVVLLSVFLAGASIARAQEQPLDPANSVKFNLPADSPVSLLGLNLNESRATVRGGAVTLDLHMDVTLRNSAAHRLRGITMLVVSQESSAFGRASVARLVDVGAGESFPLRVDVRLMRPYPVAGPLIQVNLDGILFDDLNFYGPNRLNSKRTMMFWEMEARRDRQYFKQVLAARGPSGLQDEVIGSLSRQRDVQHLDVRMNHDPTVSGPGHYAQFAFVQMPDAPVRALRGSAEISGQALLSPQIEIENRSAKSVRYVEIAWLVKDRNGRQYQARSVPGPDTDIYLPPGHHGQLVEDTALRFSKADSSTPLAVDKMVGIVSQVEFADGKVWIPRRESLTAADSLDALAPSPEEQRLTDLYRKHGLKALITELGKF